MDINLLQQKTGIIGNSDAINQVLEMILQVAPVNISVLVTGESGTGKEKIAKALHQASKRSNQKLITVNCGAIPEGIIESELLLSDIERTENILEKLNKLIKIGKNENKEERDLFLRVLNNLQSADTNEVSNYSPEELHIINKNGILSFKPLMYVANLDENSIKSGNIYNQKLKDLSKIKKIPLVNISAKIEEELSSIKDTKEKKELMKSMDIDQSDLDQFISSGFKLLNLVTFFTSGEKETKAWTLKKESYAPDAAGKIHTDFKRGFIAADVISYDKLLKLGGEKEAKLSGNIRTEGKDYIVQDGDVILFKFNV